jgi:hypothetical protein
MIAVEVSFWFCDNKGRDKDSGYDICDYREDIFGIILEINNLISKLITIIIRQGIEIS